MTIGKWILQTKQRGELTACEYKDKNQWIKISWADYFKRTVAAATALRNKGLKPESHIGLMSQSCWQWAILDMAIMGSGAVTVPLYPNLSDEDFTFIVNHSDVTLLLIENDDMAAQVERTERNFARKIDILKIHEFPFEAPFTEDDEQIFSKSCATLKEESVATVFYTSGTTGQPKGVVLQHQAIVSEVVEGFALFSVAPHEKALSFLPFAHVLGRMEHWGSAYNGHCLAYAESIEKIKSNLKEVRPHFLVAVPRIFEKVYAGILAQVETQKLKQTLFHQAMQAAVEVAEYRVTKSTIPWGLLLKYEALNRLALEPIRQAFGGRLRFAISGGAPMDSQLVQFFFNCGIPVLEGYGLSETTGAVTVNSLSQYRIGSVGQPIGEAQIKIAADGEILVKSKKCMKEYYKNPEETARVMQDGYFATGDIGELTSGGFLKITDRKKDLIKTANGKYVAPQKLEGLLKMDPLISQVLIHGDQKKYIIALLTFDEATLGSWATSQGIAFSDVGELYQNPILKVRIKKHVQMINSKLASYEAIKKFEILRDSWTVENGALTQSLKVKRKKLEKQYRDLIEAIYD